MPKSPKTKRNKVILSIGLVAASAIYALSQFMGSSVSTASPKIVQSASATQTKTVPASGVYTDGTYTGTAADAYYGTVQVKAIVQNGKLATVQFLQYPSDRSTSRSINGRAIPALTGEAIQAQNANVNIVSGATFTSQAFQQSLQSALAQA